MAAILLDTNMLSELMGRQPDQMVMDWFAGHTGDQFYVSAITTAEILLAAPRRKASGCPDCSGRRDVFSGPCRKMSPL